MLRLWRGVCKTKLEIKCLFYCLTWESIKKDHMLERAHGRMFKLASINRACNHFVY